MMTDWNVGLITQAQALIVSVFNVSVSRLLSRRHASSTCARYAIHARREKDPPAERKIDRMGGGGGEGGRGRETIVISRSGITCTRPLMAITFNYYLN